MTWHVMTRAANGTVSLLKNLTKAEARKVVQRLGGLRNERPGWASSVVSEDPWSEGMILWGAQCEAETAVFGRIVSGISYSNGVAFGYPDPNRIVQVECWGPPGQEMDVWPKPRDYDKRYAAALEAAMSRANAKKADAESPLPAPSPEAP